MTSYSYSSKNSYFLGLVFSGYFFGCFGVLSTTSVFCVGGTTFAASVGAFGGAITVVATVDAGTETEATGASGLFTYVFCFCLFDYCTLGVNVEICDF